MKYARSIGPRLLLGLAAATLGACGGTKWDPNQAPAKTSTSSTGGSTNGSPGPDDGGDAAATCEAGPPSDAGLVNYAFDDPNIQYSARVDRYADQVDASSPTHLKFAASSSYVSARFRGTTAVVRFTDEYRSGGVNFFETLVDDLPPFEIVPQPVTKNYPVPVNPCLAEHTITFVKRTEADVGWVDFLGFRFDGPILPPPPLPTRRIEIIGDSITCGSGIEADGKNAPECMQNGLLDSAGKPLSGYGQGVENGYASYGPVLARKLNAEWRVTCAGGIGLVRSYYSRGDQRPMPEVYDLQYPEDQASTTKWNMTASPFVPDVIVIGLGTNDFSRDNGTMNGNPIYRAPIDVSTVVAGYTAFIDQLVALYPGVTVVLASSPLLGNAYPTPADHQLDDHKAAIAEVVARYASDAGPSSGASFEGGSDDASTSPDMSVPPDADTSSEASDDATASRPDGGAMRPVRVFGATMPKSAAPSCNHPNIQDHEDEANALVPVIKQAMGW